MTILHKLKTLCYLFEDYSILQYVSIGISSFKEQVQSENSGTSSRDMTTVINSLGTWKLQLNQKYVNYADNLWEQLFTANGSITKVLTLCDIKGRH